MPALTQDVIGIRQARSIRNRTEEISDELTEVQTELHGLPNELTMIQSSIWASVSLAHQWKSLIAIIGAGMESDSIYNYRELASILRPAAENFVKLCESVDNSTANVAPDVKLEGLADFELAHKDAVRYQKWLECWPSSTPESRKETRREIREGKSLPWREIVDSTQGAE